MKRLVALSFVFCLLLVSCGWVYKMHPSVGKKYIVSDPEKVVFYKEASYKSESFKIEKIQKLRIDNVECADKMNYFSCIWRGFNSPEVVFYKIVLESGKVGYVNEVDFKDVFVDIGSAKYLSRFSFQADYDRVWNAALDALDESGYVIMQMDKYGGYISTGMKVETRSRDKVNLRLKREQGSVIVKIKLYGQKLIETSDTPYWEETRSGGVFEMKMIRDKMASKLGVAPRHPIK